MQDYKIYAALHYCRVNKLNRVVIDAPTPRLGIATSGKSYLDVRQALDDLGLDDRECAAMGIRVYKVGMPWPLEPEGVRHFAEGLEEILVVEEKRQIVEYQLKDQLYTGATTCGRAWSASSTKRANGCARTATGCCRPRESSRPQ